MKNLVVASAALLVACTSGGGGTGTFVGNHGNQQVKGAIAPYLGSWKFVAGSAHVSCSDGSNSTNTIVGSTAVAVQTGEIEVTVTFGGSTCPIRFAVGESTATAE